MKYLIIGLGNYGIGLAQELSKQGNEVVVADNDPNHIDEVKEKVAAAFLLDATDVHALSVLPLSGVDVAIVAIGENFGASVRVTALLKQLKVKHIYARANDEVHRSILQAFDVERILSPEADAARDLVQLFEFGADMETFQVDAEYHVIKFTVPQKLVGYYINELKIEDEFKLKLLALKRGKTLMNALGISFMEREVVNEIQVEDRIVEGDQLVVYGRYADFRKFWRAI